MMLALGFADGTGEGRAVKLGGASCVTFPG